MKVPILHRKATRPSNSGAIPPNFEPKTLEDEESVRKSIIGYLLLIDWKISMNVKFWDNVQR